MKYSKLENMTNGWFIGNFFPTAYQTNDFEVSVKKFNKGEVENSHYHNIATEITLVLEGSIKMANKNWSCGDIIILEPGEISSFEALTDTVIIAVKTPCAKDDKFIV